MTWPKREKSGAVSRPVRVVAPTSVNGWSGICTDDANAPSPVMMSMTQIVERGVEALLDDGVQAVDLVDEEDVVPLRASS